MKKKLQIIFYILMIISLLLSFAQRMNLLDSAYADVELQSCTPLTSSGLNFRTFSNLKVKDIKLENYDSEKIRDTIYNVLKDNIVFQNYHTSDENISKKDFWSNVDFIVTYEDNYLNIYIQDYKRNSNTFCVGAPSIPGITYFAAYNRSYYSFVLGFPYEYYLRVRPNDLFVEKFDVSFTLDDDNRDDGQTFNSYVSFGKTYSSIPTIESQNIELSIIDTSGRPFEPIGSLSDGLGNSVQANKSNFLKSFGYNISYNNNFSDFGINNINDLKFLYQGKNVHTDYDYGSTDEENDTQKEQLETSKGILSTLKDVFSFILELPGKIVDGLVDAFKFLFIPEDDYFENAFNDLLNTIELKLGILGYPFVFAIDVLEFFLTIEDTGNYVISWSDIKVPNFNATIIKGGSYDLGKLLENDVIHTAHNLYFIFINALLVLSFIKLCHNKYVSIFGGEYDDTTYITTETIYDIDHTTGEVVGEKYKERSTRTVTNK